MWAPESRERLKNRHAINGQARKMGFDFPPSRLPSTRQDWGWARPSLPLGNPNPLTRDIDISPADDREEVAIETAHDPVFTTEQIGWRFALGTAIIVGAYAAWPFIPVVMMTDLEPGIKAGLSGVLGATPFVSKLIAVAIMGRPAYYFLKRTVFNRLRRRAPSPAE
jgi:hypothetical protein